MFFSFAMFNRKKFFTVCVIRFGYVVFKVATILFNGKSADIQIYAALGRLLKRDFFAY